MASNKKAKERLIELYGPEDFIDKLHLRYEHGKRYVSQKRLENGELDRRNLTYHHIREKSRGGDNSVENGALLTNDNHSWFHKQPKFVQKLMDMVFIAYKKLKDYQRHVKEYKGGVYDEVDVEIVDYLKKQVDVKTMEFECRSKERYEKKYSSKNVRSRKKRELKKELRDFAREK